ncbi:uncharacterized protein LOC135345868 isoform X2 [Halichondria panicea]|uniref:uncharacterized protein LOC135345868 isoform X2 n=1 Tax=Halichondria panicea TaxID=6063 RepID=UPI00312B547B
MIKIWLIRATVMLAGLFLSEITSGSASGMWETIICHKPSEADIAFTINMGVNKCDITQTGPCSKILIDDGSLQSVCSGLDDGVTYTCNVSRAYTEPVCCSVYAKVNQNLLSMSCFTNTVTTVSPGPTPNRTPSVPTVIKFQPNEYEVTEGSDAQVCLVITNGTVLSEITIDVYLDSFTDTCREVHFPEGATVGDHQCTTFPNTSLQVGRYTLRAQVLTPPEDSPIVNTTDSATLIIHKRELEKGLIAAAVISGIVVFVVVVVVVVVVVGCGAARHIVRQRVPKEDAVNLPEHVKINNVPVQDERKVPSGETESKPCPVQERVRGDRAPGSATHRGSQNSDQSGVQPEFPPSFSNQMGNQPEENGISNANPHHVCVELPSTVPDTPDHSHGTQPEDGSSTSGRLVYTLPMQNKPLVECDTGVVVYAGASQASSLGSSNEAMQLTA